MPKTATNDEKNKESRRDAFMRINAKRLAKIKDTIKVMAKSANSVPAKHFTDEDYPAAKEYIDTLLETMLKPAMMSNDSGIDEDNPWS